MTDTVIQVENLSKQYRIGTLGKPSDTFREKVIDRITSPFQYLKTVLQQPAPEEMIWALKGVSFEVKQGEVIGVIGRNGAGKSTLFKILSRITEPTSGYAELRGRIGSLLEVGTGFNPELTGRENVYLNGTIIGMRKREIDRKLDEIIDFSGVEKFLDTPVKRYSSGMYVRLAFAVAAHLEPEILLIDEVLAVGDMAFQKKCLSKISSVAKAGRTVLFVSHTLETVQKLCDRCILLEHGVLTQEGPTNVIAVQYLKQMYTLSQTRYYRSPEPEVGKQVSLVEAVTLDSRHQPTDSLLFGEPFSFRLSWQHWVEPLAAAYAIRVYDPKDRLLFAANTLDSSLNIDTQGFCTVTCAFSTNVLPPNEYRVLVGCYVRPHTILDEVESCLKLVVLNVPYRPSFTFNIVGDPAIILPHTWSQH